jgi:hypothetical protein
MKDLFASLVDRALARTPVLERRQPTLFEPAVDAAFNEPAGLQEKESVVEAEPASERPKQVIRNTVRSPELHHEEPKSDLVETRPARRQRIPETPPPEQDVNTTHLARTSPTSVTPTIPITHEERTHDLKPSPIATPDPLTLTPERTIETIVEKRIEREVIKESTETPIIKEIQTFNGTDTQLQPSHRDDGTETKPPLKAEVKQSPAPKEATTIKPLVPKNPERFPTTLPRMRAASRAESKRPAAPPTPVIHVTIGRVEVRATAPTTSKAPTARPAGPKLSLDDYLRSRAERN